jgi:tetratricopeptide (TPR) repeat protein
MLVIQILDDRSANAHSAGRLAIQWQGTQHHDGSGHACLSVHLDNNPELKASFLEVIGAAYLEYGSPAQAIAALTEAVELRIRVFGVSHPATAASQRHLASAMRENARLEEAKLQAEAALETFEKFYGSGSVEYADAKLELAAIALAANRLDEARQDALACLAVFDAKDDIRKLHALDLHARVLNVCAGGDKQQLVQAAALYSEILGDRRLDSGHPWRAAYVHNEGTILHDLGEYAAARGRYDEALESWQQESGDARPCVVDALINRGRARRELGDPQGARHDVENALALDRTIRGPSHPYVAYDLVCLARLLMEAGGEDNKRAAERALNEAIDIYRRSGYENHAYLEVALRRRFQLLNNPADGEEAEAIRRARERSCAGIQSKCG